MYIWAHWCDLELFVWSSVMPNNIFSIYQLLKTTIYEIVCFQMHIWLSIKTVLSMCQTRTMASFHNCFVVVLLLLLLLLIFQNDKIPWGLDYVKSKFISTSRSISRTMIILCEFMFDAVIEIQAVLTIFTGVIFLQTERVCVSNESIENCDKTMPITTISYGHWVYCLSLKVQV